MLSPSVFDRFRMCIPLAICVLVIAGSGNVGGQDRLPAELKAVPIWPGEAAARRSFSGQYVFRSEAGQIVVYWPDPSRPGQWATFRFWLQNRVDPQVRVEPSRNEDGAFQYRYTVRNGASAKSVIWAWSVVGPANQELKISHPTWGGTNARTPVAPQAMLPNAPTGAYLVWCRIDAPPIEPGGQVTGFQIDSAYLPGLTTAYASGEGGIIRPPAPFTREVEDQVIPLERPYVMDKTTVTIGPRFAPGTDVSAILSAYQADIEGLLKEGVLNRDSGFIWELQRELALAIRAERSSRIVIPGAPSSPFEKELLQALILATNGPATSSSQLGPDRLP